MLCVYIYFSSCRRDSLPQQIMKRTLSKKNTENSALCTQKKNKSFCHQTQPRNHCILEVLFHLRSSDDMLGGCTHHGLGEGCNMGGGGRVSLQDTAVFMKGCARSWPLQMCQQSVCPCPFICSRRLKAYEGYMAQRCVNFS